MREAVGLVGAGRYAEAAAVFRAVPPQAPRDLCHHARALYEVGEPAAALEAIERAMASSGGVPFVVASRAILLLDLGRPVEALRDIDRSLELDPSNVLLPAYRGLARFLVGDRRAGLATLRRAFLPASPALGSRIAVALETWLGPGAASFGPFVFETTVEPEPPLFAALNRYLVAPDHAASWLHVHLFRRATIAEHDLLGKAIGLLSRAPAEAAELLSASGDGTDGCLRQARLEALLLSDRADEALTLLDPGGEAEADPYARAFRAAVLFRAGEPARAAELLAKVVEEEPSDYTLPYLRGLALLGAGDPRTARRSFEAAFRLECPNVAAALVAAAEARLAVAGEERDGATL